MSEHANEPTREEFEAAAPDPDVVALESMADDASERAFEARMNEKYHARREARFTFFDLWSKVLTAFVGGAGFAAISADAPELAKWLAVAVAAITTASVTLKWSESAKTHASLRREWITLRFAWERLQRWAERAPDATSAEVLKRWSELHETRGDLSAREPPLADRGLLLDVLTEVEIETGRRKYQPKIRWWWGWWRRRDAESLSTRVANLTTAGGETVKEPPG